MKTTAPGYDLIAKDWKAARTRLPDKDRALFDCFIENLPANARLLDLGCGHGLPVIGLLSGEGREITGVDGSQKLLDQARENFPGAIFEQGDIQTYQINQDFDGVILWDVLFHLPRETHRAILEKIHALLPNDGQLILSSGGSDVDLPPFTDYMFGVEFFYDSYPVREFVGLCEDVGFAARRQLLVNEPDGGRDKGRLGLLLVKLPGNPD